MTDHTHPLEGKRKGLWRHVEEDHGRKVTAADTGSLAAIHDELHRPEYPEGDTAEQGRAEAARD